VRQIGRALHPELSNAADNQKNGSSPEKARDQVIRGRPIMRVAVGGLADIPQITRCVGRAEPEDQHECVRRQPLTVDCHNTDQSPPLMGLDCGGALHHGIERQ